jgi:S1-C subfamily serine protease
MEDTLVALSNTLAEAVERASRCVAAVNARRHLSSSGVHWKQGVIVTADHAIKREEEITVTLPDGRSVPAKLAGRDSGTDLAVLTVEGAQFASVDIAPGESVKPGILVLAVGRSAEAGVNATMGVVSSVGGRWQTWRGGMVDQLIRLDVALYPGASGGAVVDVQGRLLGMATSGLSRMAGLAIPASTVSRVAEELLAKGHIVRGYLGLGLQRVALPDRLTNVPQWPGSNAGLIVLTVERNGPADRAGILIGDILLALGGKRLNEAGDLQAALGAETVGNTIPAKILRGGVLKEIPITVGERLYRRG